MNRMAAFTARLDLGTALAAPDHCPACGAEDLVVLGDAGGAVFLCRPCRQCWRVDLGWLVQVDPRDCADIADPGGAPCGSG